MHVYITVPDHTMVLEMYRVSKKGILVWSKDSFLMKVMTKLKLAEEYEISAISNPDSFGDQGGVDNSNIQILYIDGLKMKSKN